MIRVWSEWFYHHTASFRGSLGVSLAYLWAAVVNNNQIEVSERSTIVRILRKHKVAPDTDIWSYLDIVG
ncbi:MAG: hypothetical protein E6R04_00685 [Spirochaetes bacterium]|nr:MAG: hypothetical protein E6R04_00685 [Spirochaetota bacterium]